MLNDPRTHGLWETSAPPAPATTALAGDVAADVCIIGGGYTGLSAALHLAEGGARVALLEAVEVGYGGAGRNVGLVNAGMWVMPNALIEVLGSVHGERLLDALGNGPSLVFDIIGRHGIDCQALHNGTLHCAVGDTGLRELEERERQWQARGAPVRLLDAAETARRVGTAAYAGSLLDLRAGTIQPLAYARGLAAAALKAGAGLYTRSPAVSADQSGGRWRVRTAGGSVSAERVIVATDFYGTGPWSELRGEQIYLPYFNFATEPLPAEMQAAILPGREGCWDTKEVLSSFRFDKAGRLVFGSVGALRGTGTAIHKSWSRRALKALFPQFGAEIAGLRFESEWYGRIGMTVDNLPRFHKLDRNVFAMCGFNGRGISPGTVSGRLLARLLLGEIAEDDLPLPATPVGAPPLRAAKGAAYEVGAQLVHLVEARF